MTSHREVVTCRANAVASRLDVTSGRQESAQLAGGRKRFIASLAAT